MNFNDDNISFLDDTARIVDEDYEPTDGDPLSSPSQTTAHSLTADIVRARVRTIGVEEHQLVAEIGVCQTLTQARSLHTSCADR